MRRPRVLAAFAGAACAAVIAAGCGSGGDTATSGGSSGGPKPVLTIGSAYEPTNLDAARDTQIVMPRLLWAQTILEVDPQTGDVGPGLATKYGYVGTGNRTYEFTLREDARFSNGTPVTAARVKRWLEYMSSARGLFSQELDFKSIETPDKWTVRLNFNTPNPNVPLYLAGARNWGDVALVEDPKTLARDPIGAGPYALVPSATVTGDTYTLTPNKYYYDPSRIKFSKIVVRIIRTPTTMLKAIQSGQLDAAIGDTTTADAAQAAGLKVNLSPRGWAGLVLEDRGGTLSKPLADPRVRQALNYAIDRRAITAAMVGRFGEPNAEPTSFDGYDDAYQDHYPYDPDRAKQLLADAGYPNGFTLPVVTPGFLGNVGDPPVQAAAKYLAAVGVKLKITTAATGVEFQEKVQNNIYPAWQVTLDSTPMYNFYATFLRRHAAGNDFGWSDPEIDALVAKASVAPPEQSAEYWKDISRRVVDQGDFVPFFTTSNIIYSSDRLARADVTRWWNMSSGVLQWSPK